MFFIGVNFSSCCCSRRLALALGEFDTRVWPMLPSRLGLTTKQSWATKARSVIFTSENGLRWTLKLQIKGQSCPGSLSQAGVPHGTSCRSCQSGGYKRTVEPARRLSCYPAASLSTSTHSLQRTHTGLCNRCWSEERSTFSSNQRDHGFGCERIRPSGTRGRKFETREMWVSWSVS